MNITLCNIPIQLKTDIQVVQNDWSEVFACHQAEPALPKLIIEASPLDQAPAHDPSVSIRMFNTDTGSYSLAYSSNGVSTLTLASGAILVFSNLHQSILKDKTAQAHLYISEQHIQAGHTEDITLTALAPLMRRLGVYIVHAFGAVHPTNSTAILIIGPSGSGKTTSGLLLIKEGWRYIGNDAVLLSKNKEGQIIAWPSPGKVNVHSKTIRLLDPFMLDHRSASIGLDGKYHFSPELVPNHTTAPVQVAIQLFPSIIQGHSESSLEKIPAGIALSQIMSQSVDNWDTATFEPHFAFLEKLTAQTSAFSAQNSSNLDSFAQAVINL